MTKKNEPEENPIDAGLRELREMMQRFSATKVELLSKEYAKTVGTMEEVHSKVMAGAKDVYQNYVASTNAMHATMLKTLRDLFEAAAREIYNSCKPPKKAKSETEYCP